MSHDERDEPDLASDQKHANGIAGLEIAADMAVEAVLPKQVGWPLIAWLIIAGMVVLIVALSRGGPEPEASDAPSTRSSGSPIIELMGKYVVGASQLPGITGQQMYAEVKPLNGGSLANRLCLVALAGELAGPEEALAQLDEIRTQIGNGQLKPKDKQTQALDVLRRLYTDHIRQQWTAPSLTEAERHLLRDELDWFGQLALAPAGCPDRAARDDVLTPAQRTMIAVVCATLVVGMLGVTGLAAMVAFLVLWATGRVPGRVTGGSMYGGVYAETFALWMVLFLVLSFVVMLIPWGKGELALREAMMLFTLSALAWPVLRGAKWRGVLSDIGWSTGRGVLVEMLWGIVCYVASLPLLFVGVVMTLLLLSWSGVAGGDSVDPQNLPTHPIVNWVAEANWWGRLQIIVLASVVAPVVEETMFRGVLYRHLRDWTARWRVGASVLVGSLVNSFLFAVIHPQGLVAVPVLMALAVGFSLAREWRGSLLASITGHGLHNGLAMLLLMTVM